ncbi:VWA domain-containing protein, partial [Flavobacterium sp. RSSB_23]|uniref:VWA domain-containing protein n=1 Tax=Flavobacterium sp. RSSB_23 TaxID=3447668 RepID=UPI003F39D9EB
MKRQLYPNQFIKEFKKTILLIVFLLMAGFVNSQTITPTKTITVRPGVCGKIDVELKLQGSNPVARPNEVVLVIDVSGSMDDGPTPEPLDYAKDAAISFINNVFLPANNPTGKNKIAIVKYGSSGSLVRTLTLASGKQTLIDDVNALVANGSTNIEDGIRKADQELTAKGTFDCITSRSIVLLTDGVANQNVANGSNCTGGQQGTCIQAAITAANDAKTTVVSGITYNNQIFAVGLFGAISGTDQTNAQYTLNNIQTAGAFFTENAANLTGIYNQISTQLSWIAQQIAGTPFATESVSNDFIIGAVTPSKGTASVSGQSISWNIDFLNVETITLKYELTPKANVCGSKTVSSSSLSYRNTNCQNSTLNISTSSTNIPCPIITLASQTNVSCFGTSTGAITLNNPTGGTAPYTYDWKKDGNSYATTQNLTGLSSGTYTVIATDKNGCSTAVLSVSITQPTAALALAASSKTDASCFGASTGSVTAGAVTGAVGTVTYSWKNASNTVVGSTATVDNLPAGTYTVTVSDSCSSESNSVTVGQPEAALALGASSKTDASCFGASTGSVTAGAVTGAVGTVTYSWKNASNTVVGSTASVNNLPAGTYTVTVTDSCSSESNSVTVGQPEAALALGASSKTDASCFGASTGSVTAGAVTGAVGTVTYSWKNASNTVVGSTATVDNLPAGTYTVTVTDSCSSE